MAKKDKQPKTDEETEEEAAEDGKSSKLKLIGGAVLLMVVGMFLGPKVLGAGAAPVDPNAPTTTTTLPDGDVHVIDAFTLNLADGRFLKVGLALELEYKADYPLGEVLKDDPTMGFPREVDAAISVLGGFTFEDLVAPGGKDMAKDVLLAELAAVSDGNVADLYFHQFVMQ